MAAPATDAEIAAALRIAADDPRLATLSPALSDWLDSRIGLSPVPATIKKEAFIRLVAYIYDMPESAGGMGWSRPFINSGTAALLAPYLIQGATILTQEAQGAVASVTLGGAYVTAVSLDGTTLVITFSNAAEVRLALPEGGGSTEIPDGSIGVDELSPGVVATLNNSVPYDGIELDGRDLVFPSTGAGRTTRITLPADQDTNTQRTDAEIRAQIKAALQAGANVTITPAGAGADETFTISSTDTDTDTNTQRTDAEIRAQIKAALQAGANVTITPAGAGADETFTISSTDTDTDTNTQRTDSEINALIDAAVPAARRVPAYAVGDAGEVLKVASDGNSLVFAPEGSITFLNSKLKSGHNARVRLARVLGSDFIFIDAIQRTDSEINALIDAAVPAARRVPAYAVGDAGEVLKVASDGNSLVFAPETAPPPQVEQTKLPVLSALPAVAGYNVGDIVNANGELFELVRSTGDPNAISGLNSGAPSGYTGDTTFQWDGASGNIRLYIPRSWISAAPARLYIRVQDDIRLDSVTVLARAPADDAGDTRWAYHRDPQEAALDEDGNAKRYTVHLFSDTKWSVPFNLVGRDTNHWQPDSRNQLSRSSVEAIIAADVAEESLHGNAARWPKTKVPADTLYTGGVAPQALTGNTDRWPASKLPTHARVGIHELIDGPGVGLGVTSSQQDVIGSFQVFQPNFDLDDDDKQHGLVEVEATVSITGASSTTLGFDMVTASPDRERRQTEFSFVSNIRAADAFSLQSVTGVAVATWRVFNGSAVLGDLTLYLQRDSDTNYLGYSLRWKGGSGTLSWNFAITLTAAFLPNDADTGGPPLPGIDAVLFGRFDQRSSVITNPPILSSTFGIQSLTRLAAGQYQITFTNPFTDNNYILMLNQWGSAHPFLEGHSYTTSGFVITTANHENNRSDLALNTGVQFVVFKVA